MSAARLAAIGHLVLSRKRRRRLQRELLDAGRFAAIVRRMVLSVRRANRARLTAMQRRDKAIKEWDAAEEYADIMGRGYCDLYDKICGKLEAGLHEDPESAAERVMQELRTLRTRLGATEQLAGVDAPRSKGAR